MAKGIRVEQIGVILVCRRQTTPLTAPPSEAATFVDPKSGKQGIKRTKLGWGMTEQERIRSGPLLELGQREKRLT